MRVPILVLVSVAASAAGCWVPISGTFGSGVDSHLTSTQARARLMGLYPAGLQVPDGDAPPALTLKLRVHVDQDVRGHIHWRERVAAQVERAGGYLTAVFGVRFEPEIVPWERSVASDDLNGVLRELAAEDPGSGVDEVVAFVAAPTGMVVGQHKLGVAMPGGRHFVLRMLNDPAEAAFIEKALPDASAAERQEIFEARRIHKEIVLFAHEWAHTMGAPHENDRGTSYIMGPTYDVTTTLFSDAEAKLIRLLIAARGEDPKAVAAVVDHLQHTEWSAWDPGDKAALVARYGGGVAAHEQQATTAPSATAPPTPAPQTDPKLTAALEHAHTHHTAGDVAAALADLSAASAAGGAPDVLAFEYESLDALAMSEQILSDHPDPARAAELVIARRFLGLPPGKLTPAQEPRYGAAFRVAYQRFLADDYDGARAAISRATARFGELPGLFALECGVALHQQRWPAARAACKHALAAWDELSGAHFFSAQIAEHDGDIPAAIAHYERVLVLDPEEHPAWEALAALYHTAARHEDLATLRTRYYARYHEWLPAE